MSRLPTSAAVSVAMTSAKKATSDIQQEQQADHILNQIYCTLLWSKEKPTDANWKQPPFRRYVQLWHQLSIVDGVVCIPMPQVLPLLVLLYR